MKFSKQSLVPINHGTNVSWCTYQATPTPSASHTLFSLSATSWGTSYQPDFTGEEMHLSKVKKPAEVTETGIKPKSGDSGKKGTSLCCLLPRETCFALPATPRSLQMPACGPGTPQGLANPRLPPGSPSPSCLCPPIGSLFGPTEQSLLCSCPSSVSGSSSKPLGFAPSYLHY